MFIGFVVELLDGSDNMSEIKKHWEEIYKKSNLNKHTWTQDIPETTLSIIDSLNLNKDSHIIDVGGGDSKLVDNLLSLGYNNITVLDISENAIDIAKNRLGNKSQLVKWIVSNILEFFPEKQYDLWIDRAALHFLRDEKTIKQYANLVNTSLTKNGYLLMATFSDTGPSKCSGLEVKQYNKEILTKVFESGFNREYCVFEDHVTPAYTKQNFIYGLFKHRQEGLLPSHNLTEDKFVKHQTDIVSDSGASCSIENKGCCCS